MEKGGKRGGEKFQNMPGPPALPPLPSLGPCPPPPPIPGPAPCPLPPALVFVDWHPSCEHLGVSYTWGPVLQLSTSTSSLTVAGEAPFRPSVAFREDRSCLPLAPPELHPPTFRHFTLRGDPLSGLEGARGTS